MGFRQDLFEFIDGKKSRYKEVKFLNPDDIFFELKDSAVTAQAINLLRFKNEYLGYEIYCLLENYRRDSEDLEFTGKATFKEYETSKRKKKKFLKRREEIWKTSQQRFLRSVVFNNLDEKRYTCKALLPSEIEKGYLLKMFDFIL